MDTIKEMSRNMYEKKQRQNICGNEPRCLPSYIDYCCCTVVCLHALSRPLEECTRYKVLSVGAAYRLMSVSKQVTRVPLKCL